MERRIARDIRRMYHYSKKKTVFICAFERELTEYIRKRTPEDSVDYNKLNFELKTITRKCKEDNRPTSFFLQKMARLTLLCLKKHHRRVVLEKKSLEFKTA